MEDKLNEDLQALTQLVSYQLAINILPFDKKYSEFIHYGLQQIVKASKCRVCVFFTEEPVGDAISESCKNCCFFKTSDSQQKCDCLLFNEKDIVVIPVQTGRKCFGYITLNNSQKIRPTILASIRNFANVIAVNIENKQQNDQLEAQNIELLNQKQFFELMFMQSSISTQILDAEGWCMRINPKLSEIFGIIPQNIEGRVYNIFKDEALKQEGVLPHLEKVFLEGKTAEWEVFFDIGVAADSQNIAVEENKKVWYHNWSYPIIDINGKLSHVIIQHNDITERKRAEQSLRSFIERFELATNAAAISVWEHDFITDVIKIDDNFNKIYANTPGNYQIEFKDFIRFIHPDDINTIKTSIEEAIKSNENMEYEFRIVRPDGDIRNIRAYGKIAKDDTNKPVKFIGANIDITDFRNAEFSFKKSERKLLQINADKDRLISILGHDLKNPFSNIFGLSQVLTEEIDSLKPDEIKKLAGNINKTAINTNKLLDDILMWARIQQGMIPFKPQNMSFAEVYRDVAEVLQPGADVKNIALHYSAANPVIVFADADMLKAVLRNLITNAIKFTNNWGAINIKAEANSENVTISVSDNGIGINPDNLSKLFDISEVFTTKGTANEAGSGLGLPLCKEFVEKHGGKIWVESTVGTGSVFAFTLPISVV